MGGREEPFLDHFKKKRIQNKKTKVAKKGELLPSSKEKTLGRLWDQIQKEERPEKGTGKERGHGGHDGKVGRKSGEAMGEGKKNWDPWMTRKKKIWGDIVTKGGVISI